jgi:Glycosyl hydrolase family 92 N-terminal domain
MAKPVADSSTPWQNQAGFLHDRSPLVGISQMHDEGTGGTASLGNFPIWMGECSSGNWEMCWLPDASRAGTRVGEPRAQVGSFGLEINTGFDIGIAYGGHR